MNRIPPIKAIIESACWILFLDAMNSPTIKGKMKMRTKPSNLSWKENEVKPNANSSQSNSSCPPVTPSTFAPVVATMIPIKINAVLDAETITFVVVEIFARKMKNSDIGKNEAVNALEKIDNRYDIGDNGHTL